MIVADAHDEYHSYMLEDVDLRLLRAFAVLARVGSFTRSAMLMDVTQSAVSHGIKRLESQLGCSLFYKKRKSIHLTPEGRFFLVHVLRSWICSIAPSNPSGNGFRMGGAT